eukprot:3729142-Pyramimonas_sp.AAC.1
MFPPPKSSIPPRTVHGRRMSVSTRSVHWRTPRALSRGVACGSVGSVPRPYSSQQCLSLISTFCTARCDTTVAAQSEGLSTGGECRYSRRVAGTVGECRYSRRVSVQSESVGTVGECRYSRRVS